MNAPKEISPNVSGYMVSKWREDIASPEMGLSSTPAVTSFGNVPIKDTELEAI